MGFEIRLINIVHPRFTSLKLGHGGGVNCLNFSKDSEYFVSGGSDRLIMVWKSNLPENNQSNTIITTKSQMIQSQPK